MKTATWKIFQLARTIHVNRHTFCIYLHITSICFGVVLWEWVIVVAKWSNFQLYHGEKKLHLMRWCPLLLRFLVLASSLKQQSAFRDITPLFLLLYAVCLAEKQQINTSFIVFGSTWPRLEPMIDRTRVSMLSITPQMQYYSI